MIYLFRTGFLFFLVAATLFLAPTAHAQEGRFSRTTLSLQEIAMLIRQGEVRAIFVEGDHLTVIPEDSVPKQAYKEPGSSLVGALRTLGVTPADLAQVRITVVEPGGWQVYGPMLLTLLPVLIIGGFLLLAFRNSATVDDQALAFAKSKARRINGERVAVTFQDVAGNDEAKEALREVVQFLREPWRFAALGARIPKGVLLMGPPGTGKTLMAKAVAGEAGVPFFSVSGSEFVEIYVGVGAGRVRDLFAQAKQSSPCILFIDEIDAIGRHRSHDGNSNEEREQTLNQILVEMDGFDSDAHVIVLAATNRHDVLDSALLRPGRFDRQVMMDAPDLRGRRAILHVHAQNKQLATTVNLDLVARQTPGFVGADLENLLNEAAILAARRNALQIEMCDLQEAIERVMAGPARHSRMMSDRERLLVAYHEAGHAVLMHLLPNHDPVHKVTILPRGMAGGFTVSLPEEESSLAGYQQLCDQLVALLGGWVAEQIRFDDVTTGASNDLERVTSLARTMVTQWGMSEAMGPIQYGAQAELWSGELGEICNYAQRTATHIDAEVHRLVEEAQGRATALLEEHWRSLERVVQRLLAVETIYADEFYALMQPSTAADVPARVALEESAPLSAASGDAFSAPWRKVVSA